MLELERPADLAQYVGKEIGVSDWVTVDQALIDKFADATGDHQWIHVDVERAKREMPGGKTIAHGYLTLSLVPRLGQTLYRVKHRSRGLNYGSNRVRFTGQVPAGAALVVAAGKLIGNLENSFRQNGLPGFRLQIRHESQSNASVVVLPQAQDVARFPEWLLDGFQLDAFV